MATPNGTLVLPNSLTPLAFLPPDLAHEVQTATFIQVGTLGMFLWDLFTNLEGDYKILTRFNVRTPTIVYFMSRISTLGYQISQALAATGATVDCTRITEAIKALFFVGMTSTTLLFFLRVRAIFANTRYAPAFFFFLWLANVGCSALDFLLVDGTRLGPTESCIFTNLKKVYAIIPAVAVLVHDTLVFAAISYKLFSHSHFGMTRTESSQNMSMRDQRGNPGNKTTAFLSGRGLPAFSRTLLQDGQVYYLISSLSALLVVAMLLAPNIGDYYRLVMISPHIALVNSMACRVFRKVKLGKIREEEVSLPSTSFISRDIAFRTRGPPSSGHKNGIIPGPGLSKSFSESESSYLSGSRSVPGPGPLNNVSSYRRYEDKELGGNGQWSLPLQPQRRENVDEEKGLGRHPHQVTLSFYDHHDGTPSPRAL